MDKKEIIGVLQAEGLDVAEDMAVAAVRAAFRIIMLVVPKVSNGLGAIVGPMIMLVEPLVLGMLDKIDGKDDPEY